MAFDRSIRRYMMGNGVIPLFPGGKWSPVNLAPNTYFAKGRVLGQITGSANDVQTFTMAGGPTGGHVTVRGAHPASGAFGTFELPWNATATQARDAIRALFGATSFNVTGGAWPGTPLVFTAAGEFVGMPILLFTVDNSALTGGADPEATVAHTTIGRSACTMAPYLNANADGSEVARGVCQYECSTDSAGNITFGPAAIEGYAGEVFPDAPMWVEGTFNCADLVGLDANAVGDLGRLVRGDVSTGEIYITG
jgi:hypothetical protein